MTEFVDYSIQDIQVLEQLINESGILTDMKEMSSLIETPMFMKLRYTQNTLQTDFLSHLAINENILFRQKYDKTSIKQAYTAAYNYHSEGVYENVNPFDYNSHYPTTI